MRFKILTNYIFSSQLFFTILIGILYLTFSTTPVLAEPAVILGRVAKDPYPDCGDNLFCYGDNCGNDSCQGSPNYNITWVQGTTSSTVTNNDCYAGRPRYTFEWTSTPEGNDNGIPTIIRYSGDSNAKVNYWFHSTTYGDGTACKPLEQQIIPENNNQTITIQAYANGDCKWNHVWFLNIAGLPTPPPPSTPIPNCKDLGGPIYTVAGQPANYTFTAEGLVTRTTIAAYTTSCTDWQRTTANLASGEGTAGLNHFTWTPAQAGIYTLFGRVWNDGIAECRADCVDGPPRYPCASSSTCKLTVNVVDPPPINWQINSHVTCPAGTQLTGRTRNFYAYWPPDPINWQYNDYSIGDKTTNTTLLPNSNSNVFFWNGNRKSNRPYFSRHFPPSFDTI